MSSMLSDDRLPAADSSAPDGQVAQATSPSPAPAAAEPNLRGMLIVLLVVGGAVLAWVAWANYGLFSLTLMLGLVLVVAGSAVKLLKRP